MGERGRGNSFIFASLLNEARPEVIKNAQLS